MALLVQPKQLVQAIYSPISAGEGHYGTIDEYGILWMVGANDKYQLGNGTTTLSKVPYPLRIKSKVVSVSCGYKSTGVVTEDGKTYLWGNEYSELGNPERVLPIHRPKLVTHSEDKFAVKIIMNVGGGSGYGIIFRDGSAYVKMAAGRYHEDSDYIVNIDPGIIDISFYGSSVYFLTRDGKIYTSGEALLPKSSKYVDNIARNNIIIGIDDINGKSTLNPILIPFGKIAKQISRGRGNLIVLTTEGEIFEMNSYGEDGPNAVYMLDAIGVGPDPVTFSPKLLKSTVLPNLQIALEKSKPQKINIPGKISFLSSNSRRTSVITENGELYMWGIEYNRGGKVIPHLSNVKFRKRGATPKPTIIETPIHVDIGSKIRYVATGEFFGIAVTEDRIVNYWGTDRFTRPAVVKEKWYSNCSNETSYVTLEEWEQNTDYIQIYDRDRTGKLSNKPVCFDRKNFIKVMEMQVFADWIPRPGNTLDVSGHGGGPGRERFYKTILLYYIDHSSYLLLKNPSIREYIKELKNPDQRIGNLQGSFGIGKHHGQSPGLAIYSLKPKN